MGNPETDTPRTCRGAGLHRDPAARARVARRGLRMRGEAAESRSEHEPIDRLIVPLVQTEHDLVDGERDFVVGSIAPDGGNLAD